MTTRTLEDLLRTHDGRPIRRCPGRYVLRAVDPTIGPEQLVGPSATTTRLTSPRATDRVAVTWLGSWGLISYQHPDGTWLHTANTPEGFLRKLADLGIRGNPRVGP